MTYMYIDKLIIVLCVLLCSYIFLVIRVMGCISLHLTIEFCSCARGAKVVWHLLLPLMNSFNKTESEFFIMQTQCFPRALLRLLAVVPSFKCYLVILLTKIPTLNCYLAVTVSKIEHKCSFLTSYEFGVFEVFPMLRFF